MKSCKGCGNKEDAFNVDSRGNIKESNNGSLKDISYKDYVRLKEESRLHTAILGEKETEKLTDDMKRIYITDLVGVANAEEVSPLKISPEQALSALWYLVHNKAYNVVVSEFKDLREQVDAKYEELKSKRIKLFWNQ